MAPINSRKCVLCGQLVALDHTCHPIWAEPFSTDDVLIAVDVSDTTLKDPDGAG